MESRFVKYNPAFLTGDELMANFVVRHTDLDLIMEIIRNNTTEANQHVLVIGPRGSGKTTLVLRVAAEIEKSRDLSDKWYPLIFPEESYLATSAADFWLEALANLADQAKEDKWRRAYEEIRLERDEQRLRERALWQLLDFADSRGKRILLIVENLNMLFDELMTREEAWSIRHTLLNESRLMLLATAVTKFGEADDPSVAMFEMFKMHELTALNNDECNQVWQLVAGKALDGEKIKAVRILTGGNPRLLSIVAKFGAHRSFRQLLDDLVDLIDDHTDYFKSRLDQMPVVERKVYLALAELWKASTAREIAAIARLEVNKTSALLNRLTNRGDVVVEDMVKKTKWYRLAEGIYNIYYLMRRRGRPADRVRATVKFMIAMYGPEDTSKLLVKESSGLSPELCRDHYAAYAEVLKNTGLAELREKIIKTTPQMFFESPFVNEFLIEVSEVGKPIGKGVESTLTTNETSYRKAEKLVNQAIVCAKDGRYEQTLMILDEAITLFEQAGQSNNSLVFAKGYYFKGLVLQSLARLDEAIAVYDKLVNRFGERTEIELAEETAHALVNKGVALGNLGRGEEAIAAYDEIVHRFGARNEIELAEPIARAFVNKGVALAKLGREEEAIAIYDELVNSNEERSEIELAEQTARALVNKGVSLRKLGRFEQAEEAFLQAIKYNVDHVYAYLQLIELYLTKRDNDRAVQFAAELLERRPDDAGVHNDLAWAFYEYGDQVLLSQAETWAERAVELSPDNGYLRHTLASILVSRGKGTQALEHASFYLKQPEIVEETIEYAIELFTSLAAAGFAGQALDILVGSPAEKFLEPMVVALRMFLGEKVYTAIEISETASDLVQRMEKRMERRVRRGESRSEALA